MLLAWNLYTEVLWQKLHHPPEVEPAEIETFC